MTIRVPKWALIVVGSALLIAGAAAVAVFVLDVGGGDEDCISSLSGSPISCDDETAIPAGSEDEEPTTTGTVATTPEAPADEELIRGVAEEWATAFATGDTDTQCSLESSKYEDLCTGFLAKGKPSVYQTGYLDATVTEIDQTSDTKALVTLSNGCDIEMSDEGGDDWRVSNSGGKLASGCEQGTGR